MTTPNTHSLTDTQNENIIDSSKYEITSLKSQLQKKEEKIVTLENMLKTTMDCLNSKNHAWGDLKNELEAVVEMLRKRVPHLDILDHLKVKDNEEYQFRKLW